MVRHTLVSHCILPDDEKDFFLPLDGHRAPPGSLDLFFNSHHLMHVLVVWAVYHMHAAATLDLQWMTQIDKGQLECHSNLTTLPQPFAAWI